MTGGYIEKSLSPQKSDLEKINSFTRREFDSDSLYIFSIELCNNDIDRDYEKFSVEALYQLKERFVGKTGISDHSMKASDQRARIFDTWVEKSDSKKTADGDAFYRLMAKAYMVKNEENMPFITDIDAGIKKEVSVSCSMAKSVCSVCGMDKRSGHCEHIGGREYNGKMAYSILSDVRDAYEFSFVAVPAQREAGVTKAFDIEGEKVNMTDIIKTLKNCDGSVTLTKSQVNTVLCHFDKLSEQAELGREYKKSLMQEVIALCAKAMPDMDLQIFSGVAQVMTTKELLTFKKAFSKPSGGDTVELQLRPEQTHNTNNAHANYKI
ncbi:MAG: hypothetical protein K2H13_09080 [Eubacterium sp.]|nr:hypothetical protein [Eubacterium sp.]